jgi:hypothetical protein
MAAKPQLTDAESLANVAKLDHELFPKRAKELPTKGRTLAESLAMLKKLEEKHGRAVMDADFARDVEEGRRLMRQDSRVDRWD